MVYYVLGLAWWDLFRYNVSVIEIVSPRPFIAPIQCCWSPCIECIYLLLDLNTFYWKYTPFIVLLRVHTFYWEDTSCVRSTRLALGVYICFLHTSIQYKWLKIITHNLTGRCLSITVENNNNLTELINWSRDSYTGHVISPHCSRDHRLVTLVQIEYCVHVWIATWQCTPPHSFEIWQTMPYQWSTQI